MTIATAEIRVEGNVRIEVSYSRCFDWKDGGGGFSFPCNKDGTVDLASMSELARRNFHKCVAREHDVVDAGVERYENRVRLCPCGSGDYPEDIHDACGIFVARVCNDCRKRRLSRYRKDIFRTRS